MTKVEDAIVEIDERLTTFQPRHEGLKDYSRLNLQEQTAREVGESIVAYDRRVGLLRTAKAALQALMEDGHPEIPVREVSLTALADLQANQSTIAAALTQFASNAPTGVNLSAGAIEPKL